MTTLISKRSIASFTGYVCINENSTDTLEITEHPVQQGASITDHAFVRPPELSIRYIYMPGNVPLSEMYKDFLDLQSSREPFTIVTGKRVYNNMLFASIAVTNDVNSENILAINASFKQIILVQVNETTVPANDLQSNPSQTAPIENTGDKKAQAVTDNDVSQDVSSLASIGGAVHAFVSGS